MQKKFVGSLALLLFVNFLIKPIWIFGIDLEVQNQVGSEAYGLYAAVLSFVMIFNIMLDLGLAHFSNRTIAGDHQVLARHFSELFLIKISLAGIYFVVARGLGFFLGYWSMGVRLLLWLTLSQVFSSALYFLRSHISGLHLFKWDAFFSVFDKVLVILWAGYFLYFSGEGMAIELFAALQAAAYGITATGALLVILWQAPYFKPHFHWFKFKSKLSKSLPYALMIFLMSLYTRIDSVMLQQIIGNSEAGIYAQAFRLLDTFNQPAYLFSVLLLPMFATMFVKRESVSELAKLAFTLIYVMSLSITLAGFFEATEIMDFLYLEHSEISSGLLQILLFSSLSIGATYVFGTMLTAKGDLKHLNYIALGGFGLNVILNALLIPSYGAQGAAIATLGTQSLSALLQFVLCFRRANLNWQAAFGLRFLAYSIQAVVVAYFISLMSLPWEWSIVLIILAVSLSVLIWQLLPWRQGIELLKQRLKDRNRA
jgi:O-antigen/teichoic acid export membrane protein